MNTDEIFNHIYEQLNISDIELESRTGILRQTVHAWKTGRRRPKPYHIMAMAQLLKMHVKIKKTSDSKEKYFFIIVEKKRHDDAIDIGRYQIATCSDKQRMIYETIIDTQYNSVVSRSAKKVESYG